MNDLSPVERALEYARLSRIALNLKRPLGSGTDGQVWKSNRNTAVKALNNERGYWNEHDSYERLADFGMDQKIDNFHVPSLRGANESLRIIEIDVMHQHPYIIDFAKVRIDRPPEFSEETIREHEEECHELFGSHWPEVRKLLLALESIGIYYLDPKPGNITFDDLR